MPRAKYWAWVIVLFLTIILLSSRIYVTLTSNPTGAQIASILAYICLTYALFMYEGLHHAAIRIHNADADALSDYVQINVSEKRRPAILAIIDRLKTHHDEFIVGRQICSMIIIVLVAAMIDEMRVPENHHLFRAMDWLGERVSFYGGKTYQIILNNFFISLVLSTLLPCWSAQILPQLLADNRTIEFIHLPLAGIFIRLAVYVANFGSGLPGHALYNVVRRTGRFTGVENIPVGNTALVERLSGFFGFRVERRNITIEAAEAEVVITDASCMNFFSGATTNVRHLVRVITPDVDNITLADANFKLPEGVVHDPYQAKTLLLTIEEIADGNNDEDTAAAAGAGAVDDDLLPMYDAPVVSEEVIFSMSTTLESPIPRKGHRSEEVIASVVYKTTPLSTGENVVDKYYFDVSKPTKQIVMNVKAHENLFIIKPQLTFQLSDELSILGEHRLSDKVNYDVAHNDVAWVITIPFPPLGSRYFIELNARPKAKVADTTSGHGQNATM